MAALTAPSLLNTQPWRWRIGGDVAELRADRQRQIRSIDPDGRLLTLSCGVALHYALTALHASGFQTDVTPIPETDQPDLLARIQLTTQTQPVPAAVRLYRAMSTRRSDRQAFADREVPDQHLDQLRQAAETHGAHAHLVRPDDLVYLATAAGRAATIEQADPQYRTDLATWVEQPAHSGGGIPIGTLPPPQARPVPIRDFHPTGPEHTTIHDHLTLGDRHARYLLLFTDADQPQDWLQAGTALSAMLLTATSQGLASSMMSDLVEVDSARETLRHLLHGIGWPMIVLRTGYRAPDTPTPPPAPRRDPADVIEQAPLPSA
jgi:hypothetical protein